MTIPTKIIHSIKLPDPKKLSNETTFNFKLPQIIKPLRTEPVDGGLEAFFECVGRQDSIINIRIYSLKTNDPIPKNAIHIDSIKMGFPDGWKPDIVRHLYYKEIE